MWPACGWQLPRASQPRTHFSTESIDTAEQADQLLADFTVARDALLRLTLGTTVSDYPPND
jgi:hypothetical protein